ncbi:hypothetical protein ACQUW5_13135 [Legionella sp. CNM-1927-20]|uniref:hypothetical protein n=1 Tax=Legionella sp. CNM-1927-20 TaxID=3422221 RepID=UPI00403ABDD9
MLRFFPNGNIVSRTVIKFCAYNGVISACYYDAEEFDSHLLIGLNENGTLKNFSFSFCEDESSKVEESMFSLSTSKVDEKLIKIDITFSAPPIYYSDSVEINQESLKEINQNLVKLFLHPRCQTTSKKMTNPKELLREINSCIITNQNLIEAASGTRESVQKNIPGFLELLGSKLKNELERLGADEAASLENRIF